MRAVWDPGKARANLLKHGVRFADAECALFDPQIGPFEASGASFPSGSIPLGGSWGSCTAIETTTCDSFRLVALSARRETNMKRQYDSRKGKRGAVITPRGKTRITIYIDTDVLEEFRERADSSGEGYQTMINEALRVHLGKARQPVDSTTLRRILREELRKTG